MGGRGSGQLVRASVGGGGNGGGRRKISLRSGGALHVLVIVVHFLAKTEVTRYCIWPGSFNFLTLKDIHQCHLYTLFLLQHFGEISCGYITPVVAEVGRVHVAIRTELQLPYTLVLETHILMLQYEHQFFAEVGRGVAAIYRASTSSHYQTQKFHYLAVL